MANQSLNLPYLVLTGVVLVAILVVFGLFRSTWQDVAALNAKITTSQVKLTERQDFLLTIDRKKSELQQEQLHEQQLNVVLPADPAMDDVTRIIQRLSQSAGVSVITISNDSPAELGIINAQKVRNQSAGLPANVIPLALNLEVRGSYQQFRNFLEQLEHSVRLMDITSLELLKNDAQPDQVTAKLRVRLYQQVVTDQTNG